MEKKINDIWKDPLISKKLKVCKSLDAGQTKIRKIVFYNNETRFATADNDGKIKFWDYDGESDSKLV